jgi:phosphate transport system permease protein
MNSPGSIPTATLRSPARLMSALMLGLTGLASLLIVAVLLTVLGYLLFRGFGGLSIDFFTRLPTGNPRDPGGFANGILGTLILVGMAALVGVPFGVLAGIYLSEYGGRGLGAWLVSPVRLVCDVLAGVPSIVIGIVGYELIVVPMKGASAYAGAAALAVIMVPIVARTTEEMLRLVPASFREGSLALGATKSQTILRVVLPAAGGSVITGILLAVARIAGETAPILFTIGGSRLLPGDLDKEFPSLTLQIYNAARSPAPSEQQLAWTGMVVLIAILLVLNLAIRLATARAIQNRVGG